jgi:two-component system response regulator NreC
MPLRLLICDDHRLLQRGIAALIETQPDMELVGVASDTAEALRLAHERRPDIVLMDISMPGSGGIEATRQLAQSLPELRTIILTVHEEESILHEALRAGAAGYVVKRALESELLDAVRAVARGDLYVHPSMTRALMRTLTTPPKADDEPPDGLTPREIDVLRLLARGFTNRQIADKLTLSVRTVEGHRANITGKLGLHSRVDLATYVETHRLLE